MEASETEYPQWRTSRIEGSTRAEFAREGLRDTSEKLGLNSHYPQERIDELIEGATHLAVNHELGKEFFENPRKCMFLLGITEDWEAVRDFKEKRKLLDTLSVVSAGRKEGRTLSMKIARLSSKGLPRGTEFDPLAENIRRSHLRLVDEEVRRDTDAKGTTDLEAQLSDWSDKSIFAHVRKKLGIIKREEHPIRFVRLKLNPLETQEKYGWIARYVADDNDKHPTREIIVNSETGLEELEHEYAHSQSASIASGFSQILDRGLSEALTENAISSPSAYPYQRRILINTLARSIPEFEDAAYHAYVSGEEKDLLQMDKLIIAKYGLQGRLALARMWDDPDSEQRFGRAAGCLLDPTAVDRQLSQH